jgi:hypothetical protein
VLSLSYLRTKSDDSFWNEVSFFHPPCFSGTKFVGEGNKGIWRHQKNKNNFSNFQKCQQIVLESKITNFNLQFLQNFFWKSPVFGQAKSIQVKLRQANSSQHIWLDIKDKSSQGSPGLPRPAQNACSSSIKDMVW